MATIRRYSSPDAEPVAALIRRTLEISTSRDYPMERLATLIALFTPERVEALSEVRTCFVAVEEDGEIVGTAGLEEAEVVGFFVAPERQSGGVGSRLLEAVEATARERGVTTLRVAASVGGTPFYESRGFQRTGATEEGAAGEHIVLIKRL